MTNYQQKKREERLYSAQIAKYKRMFDKKDKKCQKN